MFKNTQVIQKTHCRLKIRLCMFDHLKAVKSVYRFYTAGEVLKKNGGYNITAV